jgi:hypothetical protein
MTNTQSQGGKEDRPDLTTCYVGFHIKQPGTYQFRAREGQAKSLTLIAKPASATLVLADLASHPPPLQVQITFDDHTHTYSGIHNVVDEMTIALPPTGTQQSAITVQSAVPVSVAWSLEGERGQRVDVNAEEASEVLTGLASAACAAQARLQVTVDAADFGRICLCLAPSKPEGDRHFVPDVLAQFRWITLASSQLAVSGGVRSVLSTDLRALLAPYQTDPAIASLIHAPSIAPSLVTQVRALAYQLVQRQGSSHHEG